MGGIISGIAGKMFGSFFGYLNKRGERQLSAKVALQNRLAESWGDELIIVWFIAVLTAYLLPWTRETVAEGFMAMQATLPPSISENFNLIIASVFGYQAVRSGVRGYVQHKAQNNGNSVNPLDKIPREF